MTRENHPVAVRGNMQAGTTIHIESVRVIRIAITSRQSVAPPPLRGFCAVTADRPIQRSYQYG